MSNPETSTATLAPLTPEELRLTHAFPPKSRAGCSVIGARALGCPSSTRT